MNKDDILAKSRKENRDKDLFVAEVNTKAATIGSITASLLATIFFVVQILVRGEWNLALYAVVVAIGASMYLSKALYLKRKRDIALAILFGVATLVLTAIHLFQLIAR